MWRGWGYNAPRRCGEGGAITHWKEWRGWGYNALGGVGEGGAITHWKVWGYNATRCGEGGAIMHLEGVERVGL